jgi:hypothetical protein
MMEELGAYALIALAIVFVMLFLAYTLPWR